VVVVVVVVEYKVIYHLCITWRVYVVPNAIRYSKVEEICRGLLKVSVTGLASDGAVKAGTVGFES
jgi:hypothetical protein